MENFFLGGRGGEGGCGSQLSGQSWCSISFKTGLGLKLSTKKQGALFQHLYGHALTFISVTKRFSAIASMILTQSHLLMTNSQSFKFTINSRILVIIERGELKNSCLSQITYIPGLTIIAVTYLIKV